MAFINYGSGFNNSGAAPLNAYKVSTNIPANDEMTWKAVKDARIMELINLEDLRPLSTAEQNELDKLSNSIGTVTVTANKVDNTKMLYLAGAVGILLFFILKG